MGQHAATPPTYTEEAYFLTSALHIEPSGYKSAHVSFTHSPKLDVNEYSNAIANVLQKYHSNLDLTYVCSSLDAESVFVQYRIDGVGQAKLEALLTDCKDSINGKFSDLLAKADMTILPTDKPDQNGLIIKPPAGVTTREIGLVATTLLQRNNFTVNAMNYV